MATEARKVSAFDLVASQAWAIQPSMLETIVAIARRENESPEAVAAKLGRPLQNTRTVSVRDGVAIVPVTGPIFRYANLFTELSGATSLEVLARDFNAAINDPYVTSVILEIDSPGGQAAGISDFAQQVRAGASIKPVIAYGDNMIASAAYWIAAAASQIVIAKTAEVGSVGAVVGVDTTSKSGYLEIVSSQSPKKRPDMSTEEGRAQIQTRIDNLAQVFVEDVASYRGVSVETVLAEFGQGDMKMGADAVAAGMADDVSTLEEIIAGLAGATEGGLTMDPRNKAKLAANKSGTVHAAEGDAVVVSAVEPNSGPVSGGTAITITGSGFTDANSVTVGGVECTDVVIVDDATITATTPEGTEGAQDVSVTSPAGQGTGTGLFTYVIPGDEEEDDPAAPAAYHRGYAAGARAELARIQSVFAQATPGHDALLQKLAFDGKTTGPQAAVQVLAAENKARGTTLAALKGDAAKPVKPVASAEGSISTKGTPENEEEAKAQWEASADIRAEFPSASTYWSFCQVEAKNKRK